MHFFLFFLENWNINDANNQDKVYYRLNKNVMYYTYVDDSRTLDEDANQMKIWIMY